MDKGSLEFLRELINTTSPSGFETEASDLWRKETKAYADKVKGDMHGNSIASINDKGDVTVMLAGHIDEIGYMITFIDKTGFLHFSTIGGIDPHLIPGRRLWIKTKNSKILGVIGKKPVHVLAAEDRNKVMKIEQLWIDIGAKNCKEAKKLVDIGDIAVPACGFEQLSKDKVVGRGFDDRAGAFTVSETLKLLKGKKLKAAVYSVATVQEEVGLRGGRTSAYGVSPDVGIAVDVAFASDFPGMDKRKHGEINLGGGPVIARGPNVNPKLFNLLVKTAKKEKIPFQINAIAGGTGTDANVIQLTKDGVAAALVSIPLRYMHTPNEIISLKDVENTAKLLAAAIVQIKDRKDFII